MEFQREQMQAATTVPTKVFQMAAAMALLMAASKDDHWVSLWAAQKALQWAADWARTKEQRTAVAKGSLLAVPTARQWEAKQAARKAGS
jgi:hypothetical protein